MNRSLTSGPERSWARNALVRLTSVLTLLIVLQAALAGQALFGTASIEVHGYLGNASFVLGLGLLAVAVGGRVPRPLPLFSVLLLVALFTQIGLGYAGRTSAGAASWHVPIGVAALGLTTALLTAAILHERP